MPVLVYDPVLFTMVTIMCVLSWILLWYELRKEDDGLTQNTYFF